jgi:TolA-binding protein
MLQEAEEILLRGRQALETETLFADHLARIFELRADYGAAAREYLAWVTQDDRRISYVDAQLARYPDDADVDREIETALREAVAETPDVAAFRHLLSQHLVRRGRPEEAYIEILTLDDQDETEGQVLIDFAARCSREQHYEVAIQACQEVVVRYSGTPAERRARLIIARNLVAMEKHHEALAAYSDIILRHPKSSEAEEALYGRGEIYFQHLDDLDSALVAYRMLLTEYGKSRRAADAAFRIGDCLAVMGDLESARQEYGRLSARSIPEEVREKAAYKLAELSFLEGDFGKAKEGFEQLAGDFPQGFYVNDALIQALFLSEGLAGDQEVLKAYAGAMRLVLERRYGAALEMFERLQAEYSSDQLADQVLMQTALTRNRIDQHHEALADLQELLARHPDSRLCPDALRRMGEIYEFRLHDLPAARQVYERLLAEYPRYIFIDEVRQKLRRLKGQRAS